jgi:hypothetical protein
MAGVAGSGGAALMTTAPSAPVRVGAKAAAAPLGATVVPAGSLAPVLPRFRGRDVFRRGVVTYRRYLLTLIRK